MIRTLLITAAVLAVAFGYPNDPECPEKELDCDACNTQGCVSFPLKASNSHSVGHSNWGFDVLSDLTDKDCPVRGHLVDSGDKHRGFFKAFETRRPSFQLFTQHEGEDTSCQITFALDTEMHPFNVLSGSDSYFESNSDCPQINSVHRSFHAATPVTVGGASMARLAIVDHFDVEDFDGFVSYEAFMAHDEDDGDLLRLGDLSNGVVGWSVFPREDDCDSTDPRSPAVALVFGDQVIDDTGNLCDDGFEWGYSVQDESSFSMVHFVLLSEEACEPEDDGAPAVFESQLIREARRLSSLPVDALLDLPDGLDSEFINWTSMDFTSCTDRCGEPGCTADCSGREGTQCYMDACDVCSCNDVCGDGIVSGDEECDCGLEDGGITCTDVDSDWYSASSPECLQDCTIGSTDACRFCGDGMVTDGEVCDPEDSEGLEMVCWEEFGAPSGDVTCNDCSSTTASCGWNDAGLDNCDARVVVDNFDFPTGDFAVEMWVQVENGNTDEIEGRLERQLHPLLTYCGHGSCERGSVGFQLRGYGPFQAIFPGGGTMTFDHGSWIKNGQNDGTWFLVGFSYDAATLTGTLFIDGFAKQTATLDREPTTRIRGGSLIVGNLPLGPGETCSDDDERAFIGRVDDVLIWNETRTRKEYRDNWEGQYASARTDLDTEEGLLLALTWRGDSSPSLIDVTDESGNGNDGTMENVSTVWNPIDV